MRVAIIAATAGILAATGASAKECRWGTNRPAIDTMERHTTPGAPRIYCQQETITVMSPSGQTRNIETWVFKMEKKNDDRRR